MGDANYEFNFAGTAWRLADGRIVVANERVELRFFDSQGRYLKTVGRRGQGPGEYQQLSLWRVPGDSLRIYDTPTSRVDVRASDGSLARTFSIPRATNLAWLPDGGAIYAPFSMPDLRSGGVKQDSLVFRRLRPDGRPGDSVAVLPGTWWEMPRPRFWRGVDFGGAPMVTGGVGGAVFVHGDHLTVYWFGPDGRLAALTRVGLPQVRVTSSDIRALEADRAAERARNPRLGTEGRGSPPPVQARFLPQATRVRLDAEGRAWVRGWTPYGAPAAEWIVFAPRGAPIARVRVPSQLLVHDIGPDYLVGVATDDDGVQSVQVFHIRR
jgi:hypothetical protein